MSFPTGSMSITQAFSRVIIINRLKVPKLKKKGGGGREGEEAANQKSVCFTKSLNTFFHFLEFLKDR